MSDPPAAQLHVLKLPENPFEKYKEDEEYNWLRYRWYLVDDSNTIATGKVLQPGDVVCFPILNTGAGEFECLRFVDTERRPDGKWLLLDGSGDIEMPAFPQSIVEMVGGKDNLRTKYKKALDEMLEKTSSCTLEDVLGGDDDEFWQDPPMSSSSSQETTTTTTTTTGEWTIPYEVDTEEH